MYVASSVKISGHSVQSPDAPARAPASRYASNAFSSSSRLQRLIDAALYSWPRDVVPDWDTRACLNLARGPCLHHPECSGDDEGGDTSDERIAHPGTGRGPPTDSTLVFVYIVPVNY